MMRPSPRRVPKIDGACPQLSSLEPKLSRSSGLHLPGCTSSAYGAIGQHAKRDRADLTNIGFWLAAHEDFTRRIARDESRGMSGDRRMERRLRRPSPIDDVGD